MKRYNFFVRMPLILTSLLIILCACSRVNEPTPKPEQVSDPDSAWKATAHAVMDSLQTYLPYDGVKIQYFTNGQGLMDSTCFAFLRRDSGTFVQENSDYAWTAVLKTTSNFRGEGEMCIEFDYHHEDFEGKTESVYDFTYIQFADSDSTERMIGCYDVGGGIGASTADERDLLWKDTLRYLCTLQEDSGAYTVIVRHKGLVEYSFDGQEIWRLVEKE